MSAAVLLASLRQIVRSTGVLTVGLGAFFSLVLLSSSAFVSEGHDIGFFRDPPRVFEAFLGGSASFFEPDGWLVVGMMHPVVLAIQTAAAFVVASGAVATEIERGTLELVLSRPVGRAPFLAAKMAASIVVVTVVQTGGVAGVLLSRIWVEGVDEIPVAGVLAVFLGSWLLFGAFAMVAVLVSAGSSLRGRAIAASVAVVVGSFFANFVALLFDEVEGLRFATPFHYFRPAELVEGRGFVGLLVLAGLGLAAALAALRRFRGRDLTR